MKSQGEKMGFGSGKKACRLFTAVSGRKLINGYDFVTFGSSAMKKRSESSDLPRRKYQITVRETERE